MNIKSALVVVCALLALLTGTASARHFESHIYFQNNSDAFVWVTVYTTDHTGFDGRKFVPLPGKAIGAWCVAPGKYDQHGVTARIYEVRAEISRDGCQRLPVLVNELRGFPYDLPDGGGPVSNVMTYYVHGRNGNYVYNNNP